MTRIYRLVISSHVLACNLTAGSIFWHVWSQICIITRLKNNQKTRRSVQHRTRTLMVLAK